MKYKWLFKIFLLSSPVIAQSQIEGASGPGPVEGFPTEGEIKILPMSEIKFPEEAKKNMLREWEEQRTKGYVEKESEHTRFLFNLEKERNLKIDDKGYHPHDTSMKKNLFQVKLAFPFKGISFVKSEDVIGFAVGGGWKGKGWSTIHEFFKDKKLGVCEFVFGQGGGVHMSAEQVRYDVNNKPTLVYVEGTQKSGFLYRISWVEKRSLFQSYDLECANREFDPMITESLIKFAQLIDKEY